MVQMKMEEGRNQLKAVAMNQILSALIGNKKVGGSMLHLCRINYFEIFRPNDELDFLLKTHFLFIFLNHFFF